MAPISGVLVGTSRESWENSILDIRVLLHGYFLHEYMFFFFRNRPPEGLLHRTCRAFRGEFDSSTLEASGGLLVVVFEAYRRTPETAACTIETSPDKKMRVGSLHNPREYDGRLPPDAGYYLNLVIPLQDESRKKISSHVN